MPGHEPHATYTDQQLLDLARAAHAQVLATGVAYSIDGRQLTRADLPSIMASIRFYEQRVATSTAQSSCHNPNVNYARFRNVR